MCQTGNCDGGCIAHEHECSECGRTEACTDRSCTFRAGLCEACEMNDWDAADFAAGAADSKNKQEDESPVLTSGGIES